MLIVWDLEGGGAGVGELWWVSGEGACGRWVREIRVGEGHREKRYVLTFLEFKVIENFCVIECKFSFHIPDSILHNLSQESSEKEILSL